jgi:hypothetical protein
MPAALLRNQVEIRAGTDTALVVGPQTAYQWVREGPKWWAGAAVRDFDKPRGGADGYTPGRDLLGKHATTFQVQITGISQADLAEKVDAWKAACALAADDLVAVRARLLAGETRVRYGRFRMPGEADAKDGARAHFAVGSAQFVTLDGFTYSDEEHSLATPRVSGGSGFTPPFEVPFTLGASETGSVAADNAGNAPGSWRITLTGPLAQPVITHLESGQRLAFTANGGVDLLAGQTLELDQARRSVLLNGVADRRTQMSEEDWWPLAAATTTYRLDADSGAGQMTVRWRDAYHS